MSQLLDKLLGKGFLTTFKKKFFQEHVHSCSLIKVSKCENDFFGIIKSIGIYISLLSILMKFKHIFFPNVLTSLH